MTSTIDPLPYESLTPGTLEAGEVLLWEGAPLPAKRPPSVRKIFLVSSLVLIVVLTGGTLLGMARLMPPQVLAILLGASALGIVAWVFRSRRRSAEVAFRVTDRRLLRIQTPGVATSVGVSQLIGFSRVTHRNSAAFQFDGGAEVDGDVVAYERMPDAPAMERLVASLPSRVNRRIALRRQPKRPH